MPGVVVVGLGLDSERGLSVEGLEEARVADYVFAEFYTNPMPNLSLLRLEKLIGKKIRVLERRELEDENAREIVDASKSERVVLLVPGDPMIATTHVTLRLHLARRNIGCRIVHGASITSAVCGAIGLQNYKFGKSTTLPSVGPVPNSVFDTTRQNRSRGLHTLILLDVLNDGTKPTVQDSLVRLIGADSSVGEWLAVGAARIGSPDEMIRAARARNLTRIDFGEPPQCIVFPGELHFMEEEALKTFGHASDEDLQGSK